MSIFSRRIGGTRAGLLVVAALLMSLFSPLVAGVAAADGTATVSGTVRNADGDPVAGARVGIHALGAPFATTNSSGAYSIAFVPVSSSPYDVQLSMPCTRDQVARVVVNGPKTVNFTVATADKQAGYTCSISSFPYIDGTTALPLSGDDAETTTPLPFNFPYFGQMYSSVNVDTNGYLTFGTATPSVFFNGALPTTNAPNAAIYALWDDVFVDQATATVRVVSGGVAPNRFSTIEWSHVNFTGGVYDLSFEVVLFENGRVVLNYKSLSDAPGFDQALGTSATVGIENADGTKAFQRSFNQGVLQSGYAIEFVPASK